LRNLKQKEPFLHPNEKVLGKVLLISLFFPPEIGGGSTGAWNRAKVLSKMGFQVYVLAGLPRSRGTSAEIKPESSKSPFLYRENLEGNITVMRIKSFALEYEGIFKRLLIFLSFSISAIICLPSVLRITGSINIVYARAPIIFSTLPGFVYSRIAKCFFIYEAPDLWPEELVNVKSPLVPVIMKFGRLAAKLSYILPDIIVTIGQRASELITYQYHPKANVYALPVGVDTDNFPVSNREACRKELIGMGVLPQEVESKFIVLYSGLLSAAQQLENLLFAAGELKNDADLTVLLLGDGPDKEHLVDIKNSYGIKNLYFVPVQPRKLMHKIISSVNICVISLASDPIFEIALPSKFYEYLACHKPILGLCKGELAGIIISNRIGFALDPRDVKVIVSDIKNLKYSSSIMSEIEDGCIKTLKSFDLDSIASLLVHILRSEGVISTAVRQLNE
jgi:glycosyltransferase involved in cell wall biosynthesis